MSIIKLTEAERRIYASITKPSLEQLEGLYSEITPHRPMITHTIDSYQIETRQTQNYKY